MADTRIVGYGPCLGPSAPRPVEGKHILVDGWEVNLKENTAVFIGDEHFTTQQPEALPIKEDNNG